MTAPDLLARFLAEDSTSEARGVLADALAGPSKYARFEFNLFEVAIYKDKDKAW